MKVIDFISENWAVILPVIAGVVVLFFPQLKPFFDGLLKKKPTDGSATTDDNIVELVKAARALIAHLSNSGNKDGEAAARQAAQAIFDAPKTDK
jgi:hypothetical protein